MGIPFLCQVCGADMRPLKPWLYRCGECAFYASTLCPGEGTGIPGLEELRRRNFEVILDRLEKIRPMDGVRILEIGSAWGWFLEAAKRRGAVVRGIEPDVLNAQLTREKGFDVEIGFFPVALRHRGPYDVIVFNDVFEHLPQPSSVVRDAENLLVDSGLIIFNLPSSDGVFFKLATALDHFGLSTWLERLWQKGLPSPHISYFNRKNLKKLIENQTNMQFLSEFSLQSVSRKGLSARIGASMRFVTAIIVYIVIWIISFVLPLLPYDIHVSVFQKANAEGGRDAPAC